MSRYFQSARPVKSHLVRSGGRSGEIRDLRNDVATAFNTDVYNNGSLFQEVDATTMVVDPGNGSDAVNSNGSAQSPLNTVAEAGRRLSFRSFTQPVLLSVLSSPATTDRLVIKGSHAEPGGLLTIQSAPTLGSIATIQTVTALSSNSAFQVATTGIDWTATTARRVRNLTSNKTSFIGEVVDANTIIISAPYAAGALTVPLTAEQLQIETVPTLVAPHIEVYSPTGSGTGISSIPYACRLKDFDMRGSNALGYSLVSPGALDVEGCDVEGDSNNAIRLSGIDACIFTSCQLHVSGSAVFTGANLFFAGCLFTGVGGFHRTRIFARCQLQNIYFSNAGLQAAIYSQILLQGVHVRNATTTPFSAQGGAVYRSIAAVEGVNITGTHGIELPRGCHWFYNTKPTITGATGDVSIAGATVAYGSIPFEDASNNAGMNTF